MDSFCQSPQFYLWKWLFCVTLWLVCISDVNGNCTAKTGTNCDSCTQDFNCFYCVETKLCGKRPIIKPSTKECDGKWYSYGQCTVSGNLLLIIVPCILGFLLLVLGCCIYCCCCRRCCRARTRRKLDKEDAKRARQKEEREMKHAERRAERMVKHDEIRKKYGLFKEEDKEDGRYHRFDVA